MYNVFLSNYFIVDCYIVLSRTVSSGILLFGIIQRSLWLGQAKSGATTNKNKTVLSPSTPLFRLGLRDFLQKHSTLPLPYQPLLSCNVSAADRQMMTRSR